MLLNGVYHTGTFLYLNMVSYFLGFTCCWMGLNILKCKTEKCFSGILVFVLAFQGTLGFCLPLGVLWDFCAMVFLSNFHFVIFCMLTVLNCPICPKNTKSFFFHINHTVKSSMMAMLTI